MAARQASIGLQILERYFPSPAPEPHLRCRKRCFPKWGWVHSPAPVKAPPLRVLLSPRAARLLLPDQRGLKQHRGQLSPAAAGTKAPKPLQTAGAFSLHTEASPPGTRQVSPGSGTPTGGPLLGLSSLRPPGEAAGHWRAEPLLSQPRALS